VYNERVDNIVGVVYSMRMLEYDMESVEFSKVSVESLTQRPPFYVPEVGLYKLNPDYQ
jgi:CBS domain containing-hemolysin-like protein